MYKCETCGASFNGRADLMNHGRVHAKVEEQYKCEACGGSFKSRSELQGHIGQKHPMTRH